MVFYSCDKCGKQFKQKCHHDKHINKKLPCVNETKFIYSIHTYNYIDVLNIKKLLIKNTNTNDVIEYKLPMTIKKVTARNELKFNNDRIALQRGPIVYCIEGADNNGKAWNVISPISIDFNAEDFKILDEPVVSLIANLPCIQISNDGFTVSSIMQKVRAIPYYAWSNRGNNAMQVWLPSSIKDFKVNN